MSIMARYPRLFENVSGEDIPPFAVMRPAGRVEDDDVWVMKCAKPDSDGGTFHVFNGPLKVKAGNRGNCTVESPILALYETADGTPQTGEEWGAKNGSWKLHKQRTGYKVIAEGETYLVEVIRMPTTAAMVLPVSSTSQGGRFDARKRFYVGNGVFANETTPIWLVLG